MNEPKIPRLTALAKNALQCTQEVLSTLLTMPEYIDERDAGFVFLKETRNHLVLVHHPVGDIDTKPEEKIHKYRAYSKEKGERIEVYHRTGDVSSFQSRMPENGKWGGGIWANDYIIAFSGLPELADEAVCLVVALSFRWITEQEAQRIADISKNPYYMPLKDAFLG